ncbi:hypothetical protein LCGC14_0015700 [marine sediment metagenome]|uniref:Uncharacterized protein n=1 Tax=marine sediment metagenome TaxID=412755 RepID=A0A0F9Z1X2_9ZZZZ|nr:hypothetical protein [Phycisphaerae bacterium]HDZ43567.1 hypothetical protein [Phycisphaerae bacterium]
MVKRYAWLQIALVVVVAMLLSVSHAQRGRVGARRAGISGVGSRAWSPVREFRANSFGAGDLPKQQPASGGGVLGSSIYSGGPPRGSRPRGGRGAPARAAGPGPLSPSQRQNRVYDPIVPLTVTSTTSGAGSSAMLRAQQISTGTRPIADLTGLLARKADGKATISRPYVTSLAPAEEGMRRLAMLTGERALRSKDYKQAFASFEKAWKISHNMPEATLSLAHTYLATADGSYAKAAQYLGKTVKLFPYLPLARVHPKDFYADQAEYQRVLSELEQHVSDHPADGQALFVLAYLRWRDQDGPAALETLQAALMNTEDKQLTASIDLMLRGMGGARDAIADEGPKLQAPIDLAWAGIRLAMPEGFTADRLGEINRVLLATGGKEGEFRPKLALSVYPIGKDVDVKGLMDSVTDHLNGKLGVEDVKIVDEATVKVLDDKAFVRALTCTYLGQQVALARVCFIRDVPSPSGAPAGTKGRRLAYVLGAGVSDRQADQLIPMLAAVARSLAYTDIRRPVDLPVATDGHLIKDPLWGYSMRQPNGWVGSFRESGFDMGQFDLLLGGTVTPRVEIIVATIPETHTPKSFGERAIQLQIDKGNDIKILSQGPATLGGQKGHQFVMQKQTKEGEHVETSIEIGRVICVPAGDGTQRMYALVVRTRRCPEAKAVALMDQMASGFKLMPSSRE